jgi:hypothetical protein
MPRTNDGILYDRDDLWGPIVVIYDATTEAVPVVGNVVHIVLLSADGHVVGHEVMVW